MGMVRKRKKQLHLYEDIKYLIDYGQYPARSSSYAAIRDPNEAFESQGRVWMDIVNHYLAPGDVQPHWLQRTGKYRKPRFCRVHTRRPWRAVDFHQKAFLLEPIDPRMPRAWIRMRDTPEFSPEGKVLDYRVVRSLILKAKQLSYKCAEEIIEHRGLSFMVANALPDSARRLDVEPAATRTVSTLLNCAATSRPALRPFLEQMLSKPLHTAEFVCTFYEKDTQHFCLAVSAYIQMTSLIRRYADIWVHRLLLATFKSCLKLTAYVTPEYMFELASDFNARIAAARAGEGPVGCCTWVSVWRPEMSAGNGRRGRW
ncbi:hypothetical protein BV898_09165 [Hypsibius exemplaris]|uniref:RNB domain-containing protein n=1 Tax=Hypsibius exemplaris TaxID=2072580 RepID=A0A1W0WNE8_HYPEX|nr:hypothetical protein BV898_09165 [Hypsibius exemplaris]